MAAPRIDITNRRFGRLVAIRPHAPIPNHGIGWECRCDCGQSVVAPAHRLTNGKKRSCGCAEALPDLAGQRFGKLTIVRESGSNKFRERTWVCRCDCGWGHVATTAHLRSGQVQSCGCSRRSDLKGKRFGRLVALDPLELEEDGSGNRFWYCRCDCDNFTKVRVRDLLNKNTSSCGCMKSAATANIKSGGRRLTFRGKTKTLMDWSRHSGISYHKLRRRLLSGWPMQKVFSP